MASDQLENDATKHCWSDRHVTLRWTIDGAEPVVKEGRLWLAGDKELVMSIPADFDSFDVSVTNQAKSQDRKRHHRQGLRLPVAQPHLPHRVKSSWQ